MLAAVIFIGTIMPSFPPSMLDTISTKTEETLSFKTGNLYEGPLAEGTTMAGRGTYKWAAQAVSYAGNFHSNSIDGSGVYAWADGSTYDGEVVAGMRHGAGTFTGKGGFPRYEGQWKEGRRHGQGKLVYSDGGDVYEGEWIDDMREGQASILGRVS